MEGLPVGHFKWILDNDNDNENILFDHNIQIYITDLK